MAETQSEAEGETSTTADDPLVAYRTALRSRPPSVLAAIQRALEIEDAATRPTVLVESITSCLSDSRSTQKRVEALPVGARVALSLCAITDRHTWPADGLQLSLRCLGIDAESAVAALLELGMLVLCPDVERPRPGETARPSNGDSLGRQSVVVHPGATAVVRTTVPENAPVSVSGPVRQVREADGIEPLLRLAALWQVVDLGPLRHTQQGPLYKRDRERLEDDPVLAGTIADALEPVPDMPSFWLALARSVGLVCDEAGTDRIVAAPASYWSDNAVHLPQMIASRWLGLRTWHETRGSQEDGTPPVLALPFVRPTVLLWLAAAPEEEWVSLDALEACLSADESSWDRLLLDVVPASAEVEPKPKRGRGKTRVDAPPSKMELLTAILLGPAYQLGLIRVAEEASTSARVVQLTALGRYVLAVGNPPPPRPAFEQFLFVQPNFEVIAYRQGLTPSLIGQFSRFARWTKLGAALELKLTAEATYRGLEGGMTIEAMLERLGRHTSRPLPPSVAEALRTWAERRQRVTYYAAATLIEFPSAEARDQALAEWPRESTPLPTPVADRLLLVEDDRSIPFHRLRLTGSRDYRRPPETCIEIEEDGVTLALDPSRADLFIEAELAKLAEERPSGTRTAAGTLPKLRFQVTHESMRRAVEEGMTPAALSRWFLRRSGEDVPASIRLLMHASTPAPAPFRGVRSIVLTAPTPDLLDGLFQHPGTRPYLGERLGPTAALISDALLPGLQDALTRLGLPVDLDGLSVSSPPRSSDR